MNKQQKKLFEEAQAAGASELTLALIEYADLIAKETLADDITLNGSVIYQATNKEEK